MTKHPRLELTWIGKDQRPKLEPRILLEDPAKSYHAKFRNAPLSPGEGQGVRADLFDNRLIFGDNLLALKALEQEFAGKVKCVYIDPPYNTGNAFEHYDDGVEHSIWLSLIRDRLEVIKRLLHPSGTLWLSIDDNEHAYLRVLLDEVFGRANFVANLVAGLNPKGRQLDRYFAGAHEYLVCVAKDITQVDLITALSEEVDLSDFPERQGELAFRYLPLRNTNKLFNPKTRPNLHYPIYFNIISGTISTTEAPGLEAIRPEFGDGGLAVWRWGKEKLEKQKDDIAIRKVRRRDGRVVFDAFQKDYCPPDRTKKLRSIWLSEAVGSTDEAKDEAKSINSKDVFPTPKPERLLHRILTLATKEGDIVLDSFAGSGTTGAVAHKMGRRWIMVELGEHCHTHIIPRLQKVVDGTDQGGISKAVGWKGGGGFRYYKLAPSLLQQDKWGNWVISKQYNAAMLAEAACKLEGFAYAPSTEHYWMHGRSTERDFIYVTTQHLTAEQLQYLSDEVGPQRSLLVLCTAFKGKAERWPNLTVKKIPMAVLKRCEWNHDDYSLNVENLPVAAQPAPEPVQGQLAFDSAKPKARKATTKKRKP